MSMPLPIADIALALSAYALGVASPGPSNLAVMAMAMQQGRRAGMIFALGVVAGSAIWGLLVALGLTSILLRYEPVAVAIRLLGGLYLLWLAARSARAAMMPAAPIAAPGADARASDTGLFLRGAAMHLTNPKAILFFGSLYAIGISPEISAAGLAIVIGAVGAQSFIIFHGYALLFSNTRISRGYFRLRRWLQGAFALAFGAASLKILTTR